MARPGRGKAFQEHGGEVDQISDLPAVLFRKLGQIKNGAVNTGASETAASRRNNTDQAGSNSAEQVCPDQDLGKIPINAEACFPDNSEQLSIRFRTDSRANLVCPSHSLANLLQPLALAGGRVDLNLYRQPRHENGDRFIVFGPNKDSHPPAPIQRLLAQREQLPEPGWAIPYVDQEQKVLRVGLDGKSVAERPIQVEMLAMKALRQPPEARIGSWLTCRGTCMSASPFLY